MKTQLPNSISTIEQAQIFLTELYKNGEHFHPEDNARDIDWFSLTLAEAEQLNILMDQIYDLPGNDGRHYDLAFDPSEFLQNLLLKEVE